MSTISRICEESRQSSKSCMRASGPELERVRPEIQNRSLSSLFDGRLILAIGWRGEVLFSISGKPFPTGPFKSLAKRPQEQSYRHGLPEIQGRLAKLIASFLTNFASPN